MTAGLDATGFTVKLLTEILTEIQTTQKNRIDAALDVSSEKALGQLNGVFSEREAFLWELVRVAMSAFDPDQAEGYLLEALSALTGTVRRPASRSLVPISVNLDAGVTLPTGSKANVSGQPTKIFRTTAPIVATLAGDYTGQMEAEVTGPVAADSGTLTQITVAVAGWNSVTNTTDASLGRVVDSDKILRERRAEELSRAGSGTPDAIRADLLEIDGVEKVTVFENLTDYTDSSGVPPHSIEVLVYDGVSPAIANNVIAQAIWDTKAPTRTYGNASGTAIDSEGVSQTVYFSRPTTVDVWVIAVVDGEGVIPANAVDLLKAQLVTAGNLALQPGVDVIALALKAILFDTRRDLGFAWVNDVPPSLGVNLTVSSRQIARLDTARTTISIS